MEAKILIWIAIIALVALASRSASHPLHQRESETTHVPIGTVRTARSSTSRGGSTDAPTQNTRTGSGERTTSGTTRDGYSTERPQTDATQSACEPLERRELVRLTNSIKTNMYSIMSLTLYVSNGILGDGDVVLSAGIYPATGEQRLTLENDYGYNIGRGVNYLRCFLNPVLEALENNSHVEVFTQETNYWRDFFYIFGNLTEAARDMKALALGRQGRPGTSGCSIPSLNYTCDPPVIFPPQVDGLTAQQTLQAAVAKELTYLCHDLREDALDPEQDALQN